MSTDVRPTTLGRTAGLYTGERFGRALGSELSMMLITGQQVIKDERTRWQFNRSMYRGQQYLRASGSTLRSLAPAHRLPSGRRRDTINRSRQFIDGRAAILSMSQPQFEVPAERNTRAAYQAARLAEKVLYYYWGELNLNEKFRTMIRTGDVDGIAFLAVYFDPSKGDQVSLPFSQDGRPIADPGLLEAMDSQGISHWQEHSNIGDISVRNVPVGRLAIDPLARQSFMDARWVIETRIRARAEVEAEAGVSIQEILKRAGVGSTDQMRYPYVTPQPDVSRLSVDEFDENETAVSGQDYVKTHEAFIRPTGRKGDWPRGAHIVWLDKAPNAPLVSEPWKGALPYICYVPRPDDGHFLRAKAIMDDLAPLNIALNRTVSQYHEILDLHARAPVLAQRGSLISKHVYNEKRIVEYNVGYEKPEWMKPPPEPQALLQNAEFILSQMAEIAVQNDVSRGTPPGQGINAGVSLHFLGQQNEQQMAGLESAVKRAVEDTCTMVLRNVCEFFTMPRLLAIPGIYGVEQVNNFTGSMLRGCNRVRVVGSLLPRNQAAQMQTLIQLGSNGLFDARPYVARLAEGRMEEVVTDLERHEREQRNENREMDLLGSIPNIDSIWGAFQEMRSEHANVIAMYQQMYAMAEQQALEAGEDPSDIGMMMPQLPPPPVLADVGIEVPSPNEWNNDELHVLELDRRRTEEGYLQLHPLVRQAYHEHAQMHVERMEKRMAALRPQPADPNAADNMLSEMESAIAEQQPEQQAAQSTAPASAGAGGGEPSDNSASPPPAEMAEPQMFEPEMGEMPVEAPALEATLAQSGTTFSSPPDWHMKAPEIHVNFPEGAIRVEPSPPPEVDVHVEPQIHVSVPPPPVPTQLPAPEVTVNPPEITVVNEAPAKTDTTEVEMTDVEYDEKGRITNARFKKVSD